MGAYSTFKVCPTCNHVWRKRRDFLSDPDISLQGYQANFGRLNAGIFLFNHTAAECGTTLAIEVDAFLDMHEGPVFEERLHGTSKCPKHCLNHCSLDPCNQPCECAYVRDVIQNVKKWPKKKAS